MSDTNDYEHLQVLDGRAAFVFNVKDGGRQITVSGWYPYHNKFKTGDRVLFITEEGESTRYRITDIRRPGDPPDQYFMDCDFEPRTASSPSR